MSTDRAAALAAREPYIHASTEALACAVAYIRGKATLADLEKDLAFFDGDPLPLATLAGWRGAAEVVHPVPAGSTYTVAAIDPHTGHQVTLDALPMDMRLGVRMETALANKDYNTAAALWQVATDRQLQDEVYLVVLLRAAAVIAHHLPDRTT